MSKCENDIKWNCWWNPLRTRKNPSPKWFEPTTLRDLFGCSNHWASRDSVVSKGEMWVFHSSCMTQLQSEITTESIAHNCITQSPFIYHSHICSLGWVYGCISDMLKKVTAWGSYELCCQSLFHSWAAWFSSSQRPTFRSPQSLQSLSG